MLIKIRRGWELPEAAATPEAVFHDRRRLIKAFAAGPILLSAPALLPIFNFSSWPALLEDLQWG